MAINITKRTLEALRTSDPRGTTFADAELEGFYVVVYPTWKPGRDREKTRPDGYSRVFGVRYRLGGRRKKTAVGAFGPLTVEEARARARQLLAKAELDEDPGAERARRRLMPTFEEWGKLYLERIRGRKKYPRSDERFIPMAIKRWGDRLLDTISREDVTAFHQSLKDTPTQANRWLASVRSCLSEAVRSGHVTTNPARGVQHFRENPPRARVLSDDELDRALKALRVEEDPHGSAAPRPLIEPGARGAEVIRARWEDVDLDAATWRLPATKAGHPQMVPLARSTVAFLRRLPRIGPWVIPGRNPEEPRAELRGPWERLKASAGLTDVTIHDLRRTFGLHVAKTAGLHVASKLLRHSDIRVTERVYAPLGLDDLRAAVERRQADVIKLERRRTRR
jgi:integrase